MNFHNKLFQIVLALFILFQSSSICNATGINFLPGAREAGLANSGVSSSTHWSLYHNPACMALIPNTVFGLSYENKYLIKELNIASCAFMIPSGKGTFGAAHSYFGSFSYHEKKFAFGYAHSLSEKLFAGIAFDYYALTLPGEYEDDHTLAGDIGLLAKPSEKLTIGFHASNITGSKFMNYKNENPDQYFSTGVSWKESGFLLTSQLQLGKNMSPVISLAAEIIPVKQITLRIGASNSESMFLTFGFGYILGNIQADIAFLHHNILGLSSTLSILYRISRN